MGLFPTQQEIIDSITSENELLKIKTKMFESQLEEAREWKKTAKLYLKECIHADYCWEEGRDNKFKLDCECGLSKLLEQA